MSPVNAFDSVVSARTNAARQILTMPELLAVYEGRGGLAEDLRHIMEAGERAEALNQGQSEAHAQGGAATVSVLEQYARLQREYKDVMAVVQAVTGQLRRQGGQPEVMAALEQILVDETAVHLKTPDKPPQDAPDKGAAKRKRKAVRSASQEDVRAEIYKDAGALLNVNVAAVHEALAARKVDRQRLEKLQQDAAALAGKLTDRVVKKASAKQATQAEHAAVTEQRRLWGDNYRLLRRAAQDDVRIAELLKAAAR